MAGINQYRSRTREILACLMLLAGCGLLGCSNVQIPAIDPTGQRIFLPAPASTSLAGDFFPSPVFTTPPDVPPCPPGFTPGPAPVAAAPAPVAVAPAPVAAPMAAAPVAAAPAPILGAVAAAPQQLVVVPGRLIAPVGTEVVLLSGIANPQGRLQPGKLIQWSLSRESVGNFLDANKDDSWLVTTMLHKQRSALTSDFATTRSLTASSTITRGTPSPSDDVNVPSGYSWISLTSSSEGASYVSVSAPKAASWSTRRQTATIHWVDAQWTLPSPAAGPAGVGQVLTTTLLRSTTAQPIAGWLVRYELAPGAAAWLGSEGQQAMEVPTSPEGQATVQVLPQQANSGATQVRVEIIRPASADGRAPRLTVGQAWTNVAWSAPGLTVTMSGPETLTGGAAATYRVQVSNPGDRVARNVVVSDILPGALEFLNSQPPESVFGDRLVWNLGDLGPGATSEIAINCRARLDANIRHCAQARCDEGIQAEGCVSTRISTPSLSLNMSGPETALVGETVDFLIEVINVGSAPVTNVIIRDDFDAGLLHVEGLRSPIQKQLGHLQPQESRRIKASFRVTQVGQLCHNLQVSADGGQVVQTRRCVAASESPAQSEPPAEPQPQPQPQAQIPAGRNLRVQVRKTGPPERKVGEIAEYTIEVVNTGDATLTNLRIADTYEGSLEPKAATDGYQILNGELVWTVDSLEPGMTIRRQVNCRCLKPDLGAQNRASVTADQSIGDADEIATRILENPDAAVGPAAPRVAPADTLKISLVDTVDPLPQGEETKYLLTIENTGEQDHKKVAITLHVPDGLSFRKLSGPVPIANLGGGRKILLEAINVVRAKEKLKPLEILVRGDRSGVYQFRVEVDSLRLDKAVEKSVETRVINQ